MVEPLTFWIVKLTTMNQMMNRDQSIQFHIGHNVSIVFLNELINIRTHRVLKFLSILAHMRPREVRYGLARPRHARAGRLSVHKPEVECSRPVLHVAPPSVRPTGAPRR